MKKVLSVLLASLLLLFCLAGCTSSSVNEDITDLQDSNTSINSTIEDLKEKAAALEEKIQSLESELTAANTKIEQLGKTDDTTLLEETKAALTAEIDAVKSDLKTALESISGTLSKFNDAMNEKMDELSESYQDAYDSVNQTIKAEDAKLNDSIEQAKASFNEKITALENKISALEAALEDFSEKVNLLQEKVDKNGEDIADLKEKVEALESEKSELENKLDDSNEDIASLLEKLEALEAEKNAMQGYLSCLLNGTHFLNYSDNEDGTHTGRCDTCGHETISNHSVGYTDNGDGTHTGVCDTCGYEITSNHSVGYTNNEDGTHTEFCDMCDYSLNKEHSYTFTYDEYMHCTIAVCACSDKHQLDSDCACYSCDKFFHNLDENCYCSNCWDYIHNVDPTTGICDKCGEFTSEASVTVDGTKTYYSIINYALLAAIENEGSLLVLENNAILRNHSDDFNGGTFTLDLNGKVFDSNSNYALNLNLTNTNITIKDSVGGGSFADNKLVTSNGTITFESGSAYRVFPSSGGALIVTGGHIDVVSINVKTATLTLAGGSFGSISTYADYYSLADLLEEGYCYYDEDGNVVDIDSISADGYWYKINNVTVAPIK